MKIKVKMLDYSPIYEDGKLIPLKPKKATDGAAGYDLRSAIDVVIRPKERFKVPCGFKIEVETGYEAQVRPRSGLADKFGITVLNSPGTIDEDYRGVCAVILYNSSDEAFHVTRGMRIAQMVPAAVVPSCIDEVDELTETKRGEAGFGSTGTK